MLSSDCTSADGDVVEQRTRIGTFTGDTTRGGMSCAITYDEMDDVVEAVETAIGTGET